MLMNNLFFCSCKQQSLFRQKFIRRQSVKHNGGRPTFMGVLFETISGMNPEDAPAEITAVLERLLVDLDSDARERYLLNLIEKAEGDKVSGMVNFMLIPEF